MKSFLNVFNIASALHLLESGQDYAEISDDHILVVASIAGDQTVWACKPDGVSLNNAKLVERIV